MSKTIVAFAEQRNSALKKTAYEVVSAAADLAAQGDMEVVALLVGAGVEGLAADLGKYGAAKVLVAESDDFKNYIGESYASAVIKSIEGLSPAGLLFPASSMGKDLSPRVAAKLGASVVMDTVEIKAEGEKLAARKPIYGGKAFAWMESSTDMLIASLRPNVFTAQEKPAAGAVEKVDFTPSGDDMKVTLKEALQAQGDRVELTEAEIIVSGGRGMKDPDNFNIIEDLANAVNGAVGASRAAVDAGWREHMDQVGQTGKTVSPNLYIACGISGAIQHLAGMSSSKVIVAINKDEEAPIFKVADYGIVGDLFEVVPALTEELKKHIN